MQSEENTAQNSWPLACVIMFIFASCTVCNYNDNLTDQKCIESGGTPMGQTMNTQRCIHL